jgi:hypothetical protein
MQAMRAGTLVLAGLLSMAPVQAHHGWAGQGDEQIEVSGTVHTALNLTNPHSSLQVMAKGEVWDITLAPASRTEGAGLKRDTLAVGDQVTIRGNRNSSAERREIKAVRVSAGGRNYDLYPERLR